MLCTFALVKGRILIKMLHDFAWRLQVQSECRHMAQMDGTSWTKMQVLLMHVAGLQLQCYQMGC